MDTIRGLHAAKSVTSFSPQRKGSTKFKGKPNFAKLKAPFRIAKSGKKVVKASMIHLRRMVRSPDNSTVMHEGCEIMWKICMNANEQDKLGHNGACAAVVVTLKKHENNATVVLSALKLAGNLCFAQPKSPFGMFGWAHVYSQNELGGKQNGIQDIVKAMERHVGLAEVQDAGIRALANLVYNHSDNVLRAVKDKGIEAVIAAMREHPAEVSVQEGGCLFIWSILATVRNESYITYGLEMTGAPGAGHVAVDLSVAGRIAELGGVERVLHALNSFGADPEHEIEGYNVGEQGCAALWFLSVKPGRLRTAVIQGGGVALAEKVMSAQADVAPARTWAARVLAQLTGKDYSKFVMPIQVPGPNALKQAVKEVEECVWRCPYYCGCNGTWGINRPTSNSSKAKRQEQRAASQQQHTTSMDSSPVPSFRKAKTATGLGVGSADDGLVDQGAEAEEDELDVAEKKKSDGSDSDVLDLDLTKCEGAQGQGEEGEEGSVGEQERDQESDSISSVHSSQEVLEEQQMNGMQAQEHELIRARKFMAKVGKRKEKDAATKKERQIWERQRHKVKRQGVVKSAQGLRSSGMPALGEEEKW